MNTPTTTLRELEQTVQRLTNCIKMVQDIYQQRREAIEDARKSRLDAAVLVNQRTTIETP